MSQRTDFPSKPRKRRSHTRKLPRETAMNMAEARRQIAQALQLHKMMSTAERREFEREAIFCYSILESMPVAQPTWSTTAPCVLRSPVAPMEEMEIFQWGDGQAAYAWWLGFLNALDVNGGNETECSNAERGNGLESGEALFLEPSEHSSFVDQWLVIPIDNNFLGNDSPSN